MHSVWDILILKNCSLFYLQFKFNWHPTFYLVNPSFSLSFLIYKMEIMMLIRLPPKSCWGLGELIHTQDLGWAWKMAGIQNMLVTVSVFCGSQITGWPLYSSGCVLVRFFYSKILILYALASWFRTRNFESGLTAMPIPALTHHVIWGKLPTSLGLSFLIYHLKIMMMIMMSTASMPSSVVVRMRLCM